MKPAAARWLCPWRPRASIRRRNPLLSGTCPPSTSTFSAMSPVAGSACRAGARGAAYAYPGDVRLLRTLDKLRPVQLALDETVRLWGQVARAELLGPALRASLERYAPSTKPRAAAPRSCTSPPRRSL